MNEYELIGRLADLDTRLKKIEKVLFHNSDIQPQPPQPAPVTLVEAVSAFLKSWGENDQEGTLRKYVDVMEEALTAEKRRQELVGKLIYEVVTMHSRVQKRERERCPVCKAIDALDAFDKERGA